MKKPTESKNNLINRFNGWLFLSLVMVLGLFAGCQEDAESLPFLGPKWPTENGDSTWHTIGKFSFQNQEGKTITRDAYNGKIWVADVFFTSCPGICPTLSKSMAKIQQAFADDPEIMLLSLTVDPETDSVETLAEYADRYEANPSQWNLVTGDKQTLYKFANGQFFFKAFEGEGGELGFIHDQALRLVDKEGRLRGSWHYDGTLESSVDSLIADIKILQSEYK